MRCPPPPPPLPPPSSSLAALCKPLQQAPGALLQGPTFGELAARGLPHAAVALARLEAGGQDLREADATSSGGSYLHAAAAAGASAAVVEALIAAGCAINGHDGGAGDTPLHVAAASGHLDTCQALLAAGADLLSRNSHGRTARAQGGVGLEALALLAEAEEAVKRQREALWGAKLQATQTESACRLGCL